MEMKKIILLAGLFFVLGHADCSMAYEIQTIADTPVKDEFILGPGKVDIILNPGEKSVQRIMVTSRFAGERKFKVEVEDFSGSLDTNETIKFFGSEKRSLLHERLCQTRGLRVQFEIGRKNYFAGGNKYSRRFPAGRILFFRFDIHRA